MTISEVSERYEITPDTLRYYERIGLLDKVKRLKSGIRDYQPEDLERLEFVRCMRHVGLGVEAIKKYLDLRKQGDETLEECFNILVEQRKVLIKKMKEMDHTLERLDMKIDKFSKILEKKA